MSAINHGGPAFPQAKVTVLAEDGTPNEAASITHGGMTLRDYFAAKVLPAMYSDYCTSASRIGFDEGWMMGVAMDAYAMADAMLAARSAAARPEQPAQDDDGWIEWNGGECPVPAGTLVDYQMCGGAEERNVPASGLRWSHMVCSSDIVAYRVVGEAKP